MAKIKGGFNVEKINWPEIMEENKEKIIEKMIEAQKEACRPNLQGWRYDVEMDRHGEVWTAGPFSNGQSISSWEGKTLIVWSVKTWSIDIDHDICLENDNELYEDFKKKQKEAEENDDYLTAYDYTQEHHPEKEKEWEQEELDFVMSEFELEAETILEQRIAEERHWMEDMIL